MIDQKKIEYAAYNHFYDKCAKEPDNSYLFGFESGVRFAESEMGKIAIEYGIWIETKNRHLYRIKEGNWRTFNKKEKPITPKEHFELFLQERNNP